jgi:hypothetical protein
MSLSNNDLIEYDLLKIYMENHKCVPLRESQHRALCQIWDKRHVTIDWRLRQLDELERKVGPRIPIDWERMR